MVPDSPLAQFKVATAYVAMGNDSAAIDALKKTLRMDSKFTDAQFVLSTILAKKGNFDEALSISRQIQKQDEKSPLGFIQEGDILLLQKKTSAGILAYERAFKIVKSSQLMMKIHQALVAAGLVLEHPIAPQPAAALSEEERERLGRLFSVGQPLSEIIIEERREGI